MKKYFTHNGTEQSGPFTIEELKALNLTRNTPIWYEGLDEWTTMADVDELQVLLEREKEIRSTIPPFLVEKKESTQSPNIQIKNIQTKDHQKKSLKIISIIGIIFSILWIFTFFSWSIFREFGIYLPDYLIIFFHCFFFLFFLISSIYSLTIYRK